MQVSATFEGEAVTIVDVDVNGSSCYVTYITSADELKTSRKIFDVNNNDFSIATSATV